MMKKILSFLLLVIPLVTTAQETSEHYFKDQSLSKEIAKEKAAYVKIETMHADGSLTTAVKNLKKDEIIRSQTYKGTEPVGTWIIQYGSGPKSIDYAFELNYADHKCNDDKTLPISDYFVDNNNLGYKAPVISTGEKTFNHFLGKNIVYPAGAMREGVEGAVQVNFTITKEGTVDNVYVHQGKHILLDKEAVRVIRKVRFTSPPMLNGQPQDVCVSMPVKFQIM